MVAKQPSDDSLRTRPLRVSAPCRLHFGLLSFGRSAGRQFGGAGLMLSEPDCCLEISSADQFNAIGAGADRVRQFVGRWAKQVNRPALPKCSIRVVRQLPSHVGLGSGTQLALATATALNRFFHDTVPSPMELAQSVERGLRSAVGTYGFCSGGFIAELGKESTDVLAPLERRLEVPKDWRFVLVRPKKKLKVVAGEEEKTAFQRLSPVPTKTTEKLTNTLFHQMIPALETADCDGFGEAVYQYGLTAGHCFAECQSGPFATEQLGELVDAIRSAGVSGVGQSSWGPTIFAVLPDRSHADRLVEHLNGLFGKELEMSISTANNSGAAVSELCDENLE